MHCSQCGIQLDLKSRFCPSCGTAVPQAQQVIEEDPQVNKDNVPSPTSKKFWLLPILASVIVGGVLGGYGYYQTRVDHAVETLRVQGENLALQGKFDEAKAQLDSALQKRPKHQTVISDLTWVKQGQHLQTQLQSAQEQANQGQFDQALSVINSAEEQTKDGKGPFNDLLKKQVTDQKTSVSISQIKFQMKDKKTIQDLAPLLTKLANFDLPEAKQAASDIKNQIADLSYEKANELLKKKQFSDATASIDQALSYDASNSKLLSFKDTISKQQTEFEQAEQDRIQVAMVTAAKEDEKNRTQAVEVLKVDAGPTANGNFSVKGQVKNIGTRPISMVEVYYTLYDASDLPIGQSSTYVYPNYLAPGETGQFENTHYFYSSAVKASVTRKTWYLK